MKSDAATGRKRKQTGLGKGLDALFPDIGAEDEVKQAGNYFDCRIENLRPNPYQPRREFALEEMAELSDSIKSHGVLQPLLVRAAGEDSFEIIAGERRYRAAKIAGLEFVPVIVRNIQDKEMLEYSIIENIQRENLNAMEEAEAYQRLLEEFGLTQEDVAERVGKSRSAVANFLRLNHLTDEVKAALRDNTISMGHGRALLGADTQGIQRKAMQMTISARLSVRETEKLVKRLNQLSRQPREPEPVVLSEDIHYNSIQEDLGRYFGTKVRIMRHGKKGKLEIEFYGNDDFDRILSLLKT
jgi:ParB family transcriptional regulator, chromosome partitioning protein